MNRPQQGSMPTNFIVQVLMFRDGDHWIAQGLEFDICAQGGTKDDTKRAFERTFIARIVWNLQHGHQPMAGVGRAPQHYWAIVSGLTQDMQQLSVPERISVPDLPESEVPLPPAFMIPVIQLGNHQHS